MSSSPPHDVLESQPFPSAQPREPFSDFPDDISLASDAGEPLEPKWKRSKYDLWFASEEESDHEPSDRPNRWRGAPSTWRNWTAEERQVATGLEQLKARDLSAHLYNFHKLRAGAREIQEELVTSDDPERRVMPWVPPNKWAAWPVEGETVPREGQESWNKQPKNEFVYRNSLREPSSRQVLEGIIISIASRKARQRYDARQWEGLGEGFSNISRDGQSELSSANTTVDEDSYGTATESPSTHEESKSRPSTSQGDDQEPSTRPKSSHASSKSQSRVTSHSRSRPTSRGTAKSSKSSAAAEAELQLVPLADDAQITLLLRRSTRHLLSSKLDELLAGLHRSRQATIAARGRNRTTTDEETEDETELESEISEDEHPISKSTSTSKSINTSRKRSLSTRRRKRSRSPSSSGSNFSSDLSLSRSPSPPPQPKPREASKSRSKSRTRAKSHSRGRTSRRNSQHASSSRSQSRNRYGLRDWSDVLGMAAVTGWDAEIVRRAQRRCEVLFAEKMDLVDVDTLGAAKGKGKEKARDFGHVSEKETSLENVNSEDEMEFGVHVDGFMRPIKARQGWRGKDVQKRIGKGKKEKKVWSRSRGRPRKKEKADDEHDDEEMELY